MALPLISKILKEVEEKQTRKEKVAHLRAHQQNQVLTQFLKYVYDPKIKFVLPEGAPPYKPNVLGEINDSGLYRELRKFYLFIEGQTNQNLLPLKREMLFIDLLESIHPDEAVLVCAVKDKKLPYKGITEKLVKEAFPNLLK